jgi:hypothetical protein
MNALDGILDALAKLTKRIDRLETIHQSRWIYPYSPGWAGAAGAPLTSTSWDGDAYSTTAKTVIDLSAVFGMPAGAKAVLVRALARDSASAATATCYIGLSPNNTAASFPLNIRLDNHSPNDGIMEELGTVPCNSDGDIYYQIVASGAGTMDVWIEIWGYEV